jgi:hypothetical protein
MVHFFIFAFSGFGAAPRRVADDEMFVCGTGTLLRFLILASSGFSAAQGV